MFVPEVVGGWCSLPNVTAQLKDSREPSEMLCSIALCKSHECQRVMYDCAEAVRPSFV